MSMPIAFAEALNTQVDLVASLWLLIICIVRKDNAFTLIRLAGCALGSMIALMAWEIARNLKTFHAISDSVAGKRQLIGTLQPNYVIVNGLKNLVHNMPSVYFNQITDFLATAVRRIANMLHVELDAPSIAEDGRMFYLFNPPDYGHDTAINPLIVWLMIFCIVMTLAGFRRVQWKNGIKAILLLLLRHFLSFAWP